MRRIGRLRFLSIAFVALGIATIGASAFVDDAPHPQAAVDAARVSDAGPSMLPSAPLAGAASAPPLRRLAPRRPQRPRRPAFIALPKRTAVAAPRIARATPAPSPRPRTRLAPPHRAPSPRRVARATPPPRRIAHLTPPPRRAVPPHRPAAAQRSRGFDARYRQAAERDYAERTAWRLVSAEPNYDPGRLAVRAQSQDAGVVRVMVWDPQNPAKRSETLTMRRTANGFAVVQRVPVATPEPSATPRPTPTPSPTPHPRRRRFL
ncbi:MAG: hypothetical protein JOZ24_05625 [Candidatus Eremiobacteraeota bacterium]|nr:hypothetical protein [Candidatus Eremiobacteraeota bacterium]